MDDELIAGIGKYIVGKSPDILLAIGLGSCIGCNIYDPKLKIGGLAHIMLPNSKQYLNVKSKLSNNKFADIAISLLVKEMISNGSKIEDMVAKIVGGAHIFEGIIKNDSLDIGKRNEEAVKEELKKLGIKIIAKSTGGNIGRTTRFELETGIIHINTKEGKFDI
jgi:chemotaxis protein CheD